MRRPNILILYTDQQRWDALGANHKSEIKTPNLDELARNGVNFSHHFVQNPVCMPSRISMLSGQYCSALGITHMGVPVPQGIITLPRILKQYGYHTANIGKLHFLPHANREHREPHPDYGFDHLEISDEPGPYEDAYRAWVRQRAPDQMDKISAGIPPGARFWKRTLRIDDPVVHRGDPEGRQDYDDSIPFAAADDLTHTAFVAEQTIEFINRQGRQPFLCIAGFYSPHSPWMVPQKYLDLYQADELSVPAFPPQIDEQRPLNGAEMFSDAQLRRAKRGYYAMISEVDDYVGKILAALDSSGQRDNTIVVFTSDHGEWLGSHLKFGKGYPADDGVSRVPLIISSPNGNQDQHYHGIVEAVDIVPTLLSLASIQIPPNLHGESLADVLRHGAESTKQLALTEGNGWKCLRLYHFRFLIHADGSEALWHIDRDPGEYHDISSEPRYQTALMECRHLLLRRLLEIERPLPRTWTY